MLYRCHKIIDYFYNASVILGKQIGKILHHLLLNMDYDLKDII